MVKLTINGIDISVDTPEEAGKLLSSMSATPGARKSTAGSVKEGSAHDLYNRASPEKRAAVIRAYVRDHIADNKRVNRFTLGFLAPAKPSGIMFREWVSSGEIEADDETIVKLADESIARVGFNNSTVSAIFRAYNVSSRAALVKA